MNRFHHLLLFYCLFSGVCAAQNPQICMQVIGSTGKSTTQNGRYYAYTVGEVVINTVKGNSYTLSQGFHQPDVCPIVSTNDLNLAAWEVAVFPNPTTNLLHVSFDAAKSGILTATLFDLLGRTILPQVALTQSTDTTIDCTGIQPGVYFLHLSDPISHAAATVRVVRL